MYVVFSRMSLLSMILPMLHILWEKLIKVHNIVSHLIKNNNISWLELGKATETVHATD